MNPEDIQKIYSTHPGVEALMQLKEEGAKESAALEGLLGRSAALILCGLKHLNFC